MTFWKEILCLIGFHAWKPRVCVTAAGMKVRCTRCGHLYYVGHDGQSMVRLD